MTAVVLFVYIVILLALFPNLLLLPDGELYGAVAGVVMVRCWRARLPLPALLAGAALGV